jgi:hypothetical protein
VGCAVRFCPHFHNHLLEAGHYGRRAEVAEVWHAVARTERQGGISCSRQCSAHIPKTCSRAYRHLAGWEMGPTFVMRPTLYAAIAVAMTETRPLVWPWWQAHCSRSSLVRPPSFRPWSLQSGWCLRRTQRIRACFACKCRISVVRL